ncbi:exported hypothetical protein [Micrococcus luteus]|nr:exported hypothetical protein [Micrococcus luteus]
MRPRVSPPPSRARPGRSAATRTQGTGRRNTALALHAMSGNSPVATDASHLTSSPRSPTRTLGQPLTAVYALTHGADRPLPPRPRSHRRRARARRTDRQRRSHRPHP